jgi:hypothetical protein
MAEIMVTGKLTKLALQGDAAAREEMQRRWRLLIEKCESLRGEDPPAQLPAGDNLTPFPRFAPYCRRKLLQPWLEQLNYSLSLMTKVFPEQLPEFTRIFYSWLRENYEGRFEPANLSVDELAELIRSSKMSPLKS